MPVSGKRCIPSSKTSRPAWEPTHPLSTWVIGPVSPGLKRPGCEAVLSPPCNSQFTKKVSYTYTTSYAFIAFTGTFPLPWQA